MSQTGAAGVFLADVQALLMLQPQTVGKDQDRGKGQEILPSYEMSFFHALDIELMSRPCKKMEVICYILATQCVFCEPAV